MSGFPLLLAAATGEDTPLKLPADTARHMDAVSGGSSSLVRTIVGLAVVIGVIYGVAWVLRQIKDSRETASQGVGLSNAATIALGPNRALHLVRAGREFVLVGVSEQSVTPIRTYSEEEARAIGLFSPEDDPDVVDARPSLPIAGKSTLAERLRALTAR